MLTFHKKRHEIFEVIVFICTFVATKQASLYFLVETCRFRAAFFYYIMPKRVTFYIDGFNFYYGLRRIRKGNPVWGKYYWIDMVKLCKSFLGEDQELMKVIYFTATPLSPSKSSRQSAFLNANKLINGEKFEIVRGKYFTKTFDCPHCNGSIPRPEEKRTDVNISVRMMGDCFLDNTDTLVLVSADSDLVPPLEFIQRYFKNKKLKVYFPPSDSCRDLSDNLKRHGGKPSLMEKNEARFREAIMPDKVSVGTSVNYEIPEKWKKFSIVTI